jgi:hypothetical protein
VTRAEMEKFLSERGWSTWYHPDYWVHTKTIADPKQQDHTNYGMHLEDAYLFETKKLPPFQPAFGIPRLNMEAQGRECIAQGLITPADLKGQK